jgi:hypothetical protein
MCWQGLTHPPVIVCSVVTLSVCWQNLPGPYQRVRVGDEAEDVNIDTGQA